MTYKSLYCVTLYYIILYYAHMVMLHSHIQKGKNLPPSVSGLSFQLSPGYRYALLVF